MAPMAIQLTEQQLHSEQVRERILDAAEQLFHQYGYKKVSVREIASAAGVTTGALYYHFKDKEQILSAMFWRSARVHSDLFQSSKAPLDDLERLLCQTMIDPILKDGKELTRQRLFSTLHFEYISDFEKCVALLVEHGVQQGIFTREISKEAMIDLFCALYRGTVLQFAMSTGEMDLHAVMKNRFHVVLRAVLGVRDAQ